MFGNAHFAFHPGELRLRERVDRICEILHGLIDDGLLPRLLEHGRELSDTVDDVLQTRDDGVEIDIRHLVLRKEPGLQFRLGGVRNGERVDLGKESRSLGGELARLFAERSLDLLVGFRRDHAAVDLVREPYRQRGHSRIRKGMLAERRRRDSRRIGNGLAYEIHETALLPIVRDSHVLAHRPLDVGADSVQDAGHLVGIRASHKTPEQRLIAVDKAVGDRRLVFYMDVDLRSDGLDELGERLAGALRARHLGKRLADVVHADAPNVLGEVPVAFDLHDAAEYAVVDEQIETHVRRTN